MDMSHVQGQCRRIIKELQIDKIEKEKVYVLSIFMNQNSDNDSISDAVWRKFVFMVVVNKIKSNVLNYQIVVLTRQSAVLETSINPSH